MVVVVILKCYGLCILYFDVNFYIVKRLHANTEYWFHKYIKWILTLWVWMPIHWCLILVYFHVTTCFSMLFFISTPRSRWRLVDRMCLDALMILCKLYSEKFETYQCGSFSTSECFPRSQYIFKFHRQRLKAMNMRLLVIC